jgi:hypothetical protein
MLPPLPMPQNPGLPLFDYGLFKPNEIAFNRIKDLINPASPPEITAVRGHLWTMDGFPYLDCDNTHGKLIAGFVITFDKQLAEEAYKRISVFMPATDYRWGQITFHQPAGLSVNILKRASSGPTRPKDGSFDSPEPEWRGKNDPMFNEAMKVVKDTVDTLAEIPFAHDPFEWDRLFRLQMAYLLLWSVIERYCSFAYGLCLDPNKKQEPLAVDRVFQNALLTYMKNPREIHSTRYQSGLIRLRKAKPVESMKYYYGVRSNIAHRGKASWDDGEIVRLSLFELFDIFQLVLKDTLFSL